MKKVVLLTISVYFLQGYSVTALKDSKISINDITFDKVAGETFEIESNDKICIIDNKGELEIKVKGLNIPLTTGCRTFATKTEQEASLSDSVTELGEVTSEKKKAGVSLYSADENETQNIELELK